MNILLYGVVSARSAPGIELPDDSISSQEYGGIRVLYSMVNEGQTFGPDQMSTFHTVICQILRQTDILPYRFPTVIAHDKLMESLEGEGARYCAALADVAGCVQIDVELPAGVAVPEISSGADYLKSKAAALRRIEDLRQSAGAALLPFAKRTRTTNRPKSIVIHTLISRGAIEEFVLHARRTYPDARVTGPWAPSVFAPAGATP